MRLDHLLSKENMLNESLTKSSVSKGRVKASLFNFEDSERDLEKRKRPVKRLSLAGV